MLDGCVKMGASLLDYYNPDGSKRRDKDDEKDFEDELEKFFEGASCTGFDKEIQDYYEDRDRKRSRSPLRSRPRQGSVYFSGGGGGNKVSVVRSNSLVMDRCELISFQVEKVSSTLSQGQKGDPAFISLASDIRQQDKKLKRTSVMSTAAKRAATAAKPAAGGQS